MMGSNRTFMELKSPAQPQQPTNKRSNRTFMELK